MLFNETYGLGDGLGQLDFGSGGDPFSGVPAYDPNPPIYVCPDGSFSPVPCDAIGAPAGAGGGGGGYTPAGATPPFGGGGEGGGVLPSIISGITRSLPGIISAARGYPAPGTPGYYPSSPSYYPTATGYPQSSPFGGSLSLGKSSVGGSISWGTVAIGGLIIVAFLGGRRGR